MKKREMVALLRDRSAADLSEDDANEIFDHVINLMKESLIKDNVLTLRHFASMRVIQKPQRKARDPRDGSTIIVPARKRVKFRIAKALKDSLNPQMVKHTDKEEEEEE